MFIQFLIRKKRFLLYILFLPIFYLANPNHLHAETPGEMVEQAQEHYANGDYHAAIELWDGLKTLGFVNANLFYNIGNAYWNLGQGGQARRYFLKATRWQPRDSDIRANLSFVEDQLKLNGSQAELNNVITKIPWWYLSLSFSESLAFSLFFITLFLILRGILQLKKKKFLKISSFVILGFFVFSCSQLMYRGFQRYRLDEAVVINASALLLQAPVKGSKKGELLPEGSQVRIQRAEGEFALVKTGDGDKGWVLKEQLGEI